MKKRTQGEIQGREREQTSQGAVVRRPLTAAERSELRKAKPARSCYDCIFCISNLLLWARTLMSGFPVAGQCANHPDAPGQMREVPGTPCRSFQAKSWLDRAEPTPSDPNVRYIRLTRGLHAIVDAADYEWLSQYKWYAGRPAFSGTCYARRCQRGGTMLMHRMIMKPPKGKVVDHINGNGLDNRRCNLRICNRRENAWHARKHRSAKLSRFIGVIPHGRKWLARVAGQRLGLFDTEVEAARARDRKARELFGEFAWLNFPPEQGQP